MVWLASLHFSTVPGHALTALYVRVPCPPPLSSPERRFLRALLLQRVQALSLEISVCSGFFATAYDVCVMYLELRESGSLVGDMSSSDGFGYGVLAWYKVPHKNVSDWRHGTRTHEGNYFLNSLILLALMPVFTAVGDTPYTKAVIFHPQHTISEVCPHRCPQYAFNMADFESFNKCLPDRS